MCSLIVLMPSVTMYNVDGHKNKIKITKSEVRVQTFDCLCAPKHNTQRGFRNIWAVCCSGGGVIVGQHWLLLQSGAGVNF